ncbi:MAG: FAD-dependent oxidoreductase [Kineosporiaceae bacterium]
MTRAAAPWDRRDLDPDDAARRLSAARHTPFWIDRGEADGVRPAARPPLDGDQVADLAVVGGGLSGVWTALQAVQANPGRDVVLLDGGRLAWAASGRNGGFCSSSLTHGWANGHSRWPQDMPRLVDLAARNLDGIAATVEEFAIDCDFRISGELTVAVADWQVEGLREIRATASRYGVDLQWLEGADLDAVVASPTYRAALRDPSGTALVDPARLVWGLTAAAESLGVRVHEGTRVTGLRDEGDRVRLDTPHGGVHARQVVLATNAFPSPLHRVRPYVVPVWDHVLVTQPLSPQQREALRWAGEEGLSDAGGMFHYYRLTPDGRLLWGGYDALYYFGGDLSAVRERRPVTEAMLLQHLETTFPALAGIGISHVWAGAIDTSTRFTPFWRRAMGGRLVAVQGFTGLGVGSSRFAAAVCLDLLDGRSTERTDLAMVRRGPVPFPPEPLRWGAIEVTRRAIARSEARAGRRGPWLRLLDRAGLGFDS